VKPFEEREGKIPESEIPLENISGMEGAKRVLEVALAGSYGVVFLYNSDSRAVDLVRAGKRIAGKSGLAFHGLAYPVCPCGRYGSRTTKCMCKHTVISRHLAKLGRRQHEFDLWFDACRVKPVEMTAESGEAEANVVKRILAVRKDTQVVMEPDNDAAAFLKQWQEHTDGACDADRILRIAGTIARLDNIGTTLRPHHVGEAIQYQIQAISWLYDHIKPQSVELKNNQQQKEVITCIRQEYRKR
jgi:predicted ATPase with chaperone activity